MSIALLLLVVSLYSSSVLMNEQSTSTSISTEDEDPPSGSQDTIIGKIDEHDRYLQELNQTWSSKIQSMSESGANATETFKKKYDNLSSAIGQLNEKLKTVLTRLNGDTKYVMIQGQCESSADVCDCSEIEEMGFTLSGMYRLNVLHQRKRRYFFAYCDMTNGSWTVFQRRNDGSENFYRGWSDYANGFGNPKGEYWLGNELLHLLTSKRSYRLRINVEDIENVARVEEYTTFRIASSADKYRLTVGGYSGNTSGYFGMSSGLGYDTGSRFTTKDSDNDGWSDGNYAVVERGAWWYSSSIRLSNLNGVYLGGIDWREFAGKSYSLKTTVLKISSDS